MQGSNDSLLRYPLLQSSHFWSCKKSLWADRVLFATPPEICCSNPRAKANSERQTLRGKLFPCEVQHLAAASPALRGPRNHEVSPAELKLISASSGKMRDKASKKKDKKLMRYFFFYAGDHSFAQEWKERSEESGSSCCPTPTAFCSSSGRGERDLKCAMIGKHSTRCIRDIESNTNHIPGYLFVFLVQTLYANIRHIDK